MRKDASHNRTFATKMQDGSKWYQIACPNIFNTYSTSFSTASQSWSVISIMFRAIDPLTPDDLSWSLRSVAKSVFESRRYQYQPSPQFHQPQEEQGFTNKMLLPTRQENTLLGFTVFSHPIGEEGTNRISINLKILQEKKIYKMLFQGQTKPNQNGLMEIVLQLFSSFPKSERSCLLATIQTQAQSMNHHDTKDWVSPTWPHIHFTPRKQHGHGPYKNERCHLWRQ